MASKEWKPSPTRSKKEIKRDPNPVEAYNRITLKLKKRLFKKSNTREAVDQFQALREAVARDGDRQFAAFCTLALARCERALGNVGRDTELSVEAGRMLWEEELAGHAVAFNEMEENASDAVQCYAYAIGLYLRQGCPRIAAGLYNEMADALRLLRKEEEASECYLAAGRLLLDDAPTTAISLFASAVDCKIQLADYDGAVEISSGLLAACRHAVDAGAVETGVAAAGLPFVKRTLVGTYVTVALLLLLQRLVDAIDGLLDDFVAMAGETLGMSGAREVLESMRDRESTMTATTRRTRTSSATAMLAAEANDTFLPDDALFSNDVNEVLTFLFAIADACRRDDLQAISCIRNVYGSLLSADQNELMNLVALDISRS